MSGHPTLAAQPQLQLTAGCRTHLGGQRCDDELARLSAHPLAELPLDEAVPSLNVMLRDGRALRARLEQLLEQKRKQEEAV